MTRAFVLATLAALLMAGGPAVADVTLADISGAWTGKGYVQKDDKTDPMNVRCEIEGAQHADEIGFDGECRAMLILKRKIGASIVVDDGRMSGTYLGSRVGVAALEGGAASDGRVVLTMRFPREVNGDDVATMTIHLHGKDAFTIETVDRMASGEDVTTSLIRFERQ